MNLITNKWQSFEYDLNNAILNKYNFIRSIIKFKKAILLNLSNKQTCSVMFKVQLTDGRTRSISHLQLISKKEINNLKYYFYEFWLMRDEEYSSFAISKIIYYYRVNEVEVIKTKFNRATLKRTGKDVIKIGGYNFPISQDLSNWGEIISVDEDKEHYVISSGNGYSKFIVKINGSERTISYLVQDKTVLKFKDLIIDDSSFIRVINNNKYHFKNGILILKERKLYLRKISKTKKHSTPKLDKFLTMDLETRSINGTMEVFAVSIYDGSNISFFYLSDYQNSEDLLINSIGSLMVSKYHGYRVYLHNLSHFDGIFLLRILSSLTPSNNIIIRDHDIIEIKFTFRNYSIYFRDSLLLLPSSLRKLAVAFNVEDKGVFPYTFVNEAPLSYKGPVPEFKYFDKITVEQYKEYCKQFEDKPWNLRVETEKYCNQDTIVLYNILKIFFLKIFKLYRVHVLNFKTLSSLAFGIYKSNFMVNEDIPIIRGETYHFISKSYKGGYVDVFKPQGENLYFYDVNSLYPYIMKTCKLPIGNPTLFNGDITKIYPDILSDKDKYLFLEVDVVSPKDLDKPFLLHRVNNRTLAPLGK